MVASDGVFVRVVACYGIVCLRQVVFLLALKLLARRKCRIPCDVHVAMRHHSNHRLGNAM